MVSMSSWDIFPFALYTMGLKHAISGLRVILVTHAFGPLSSRFSQVFTIIFVSLASRDVRLNRSGAAAPEHPLGARYTSSCGIPPTTLRSIPP